MLPALLAPILSALASNGLSLLSDAVMAKGKDVIEETLGVSLPTKVEELTPDLIAHLKERTMEHEEKLQEMLLEAQRLTLESERIANENTASARDMNSRIQETKETSRFVKEAAYYLDFIIVISTIVVVGLIIFVPMPEANLNLAFGLAGSLITLCGTIVNFHRGTSAGSKNKDAVIKRMQEDANNG